MKKAIKVIITVILTVLAGLFILGLLFLKPGLEDLGVTKIELGSSNESGIREVYNISYHITDEEKRELERIFAKAYVGEGLLEEDIEKAVRWVSSDNSAIWVNPSAFEIQVYEKAIGQEIEIYAENFDGSVRSASIKIITQRAAVTTTAPRTLEEDLASIKSIEGPSSGKQESYIVLTGRKFNRSIKFYSYTDEAGKDRYNGNTDLGELVRWVSTNEKVAVVKSEVLKTYAYYVVTLTLEITGEGEAEIYGETIDGRVKTETVKIISGNKYAKDAAATFHAGEYILSKVKYPTKTSERIKHDRDPWFFENWLEFGPNKDRRIYVYSKNTESSSVGVKTVEIDGLNVTIKGDVKTFSSAGMDVTCNYILKLSYNKDFTEYTVVSEKYDVPEIIREKLE